jgi:GNAT superfamily N-acetyltransferase
VDEIKLVPLTDNDTEQFVRDNQEAFRYGALEEFEVCCDHTDENGEIISKKCIVSAIRSGAAYRIICKERIVGGLVIKTEGFKGELLLLFVSPEEHGKGIGYAAWSEVERMHPEVKLWETATPYFEKRNIHFYVNKCGFHIVEFFNSHHHGCDSENAHDGADDEMFRFEKKIE